MSQIIPEKIIHGLFSVLAYVGSRSLALDLSAKCKAYLESNLVRKLIVFSIAFTSTKDLTTSLIVTFLYVVLVRYVLFESDLPEQIEKQF